MSDMEKLTGVILAGGDNRRFPYRKGWIRVEGERLIDRTLRIFRGIFPEVIISTNVPGDYFSLGARMIGDVVPGRGPMGGIFSALLNAPSAGIFVAACDMPFIKPRLVRYLAGLSEKSGIVACSFGGKTHPLLAVYGRDLLSDFREHLERGTTSLRMFLSEHDAFIVQEEEVRKIDPEGASFVNINTPLDYNKFIGGETCSA